MKSLATLLATATLLGGTACTYAPPLETAFQRQPSPARAPLEEEAAREPPVPSLVIHTLTERGKYHTYVFEGSILNTVIVVRNGRAYRSLGDVDNVNVRKEAFELLDPENPLIRKYK